MTIIIPKRTVHITVGIISGFMLTFLLALGILLIRGSTQDDGIHGVTTKFQPPAGAKLIAQRVTGPHLICVDDDPCPSLHKHWRGKSLTAAQMQQLADQAGWRATVDGDCQPQEYSFGEQTLCSFTAVQDGYSISFTQKGGMDNLSSVDYYLDVQGQNSRF